jgi:hypothetical protein
MDNNDYLRIKARDAKHRNEERPIKKGKCECGRKMMWARNGSKPLQCSTCATLGLEESRRRFLQLGMKVMEVSA